MKLIDIIIPVYNTPFVYLDRCIKSVLRQTYKNIHVIIVDDGSNSKTKGILKLYVHDKRIEIVSQKNQGVSSARNQGLKKSYGEIVVFLDSDDYICEDYIERYVEKIENKKLELLFSGLIDDGAKKNKSLLRNMYIDIANSSREILLNSDSFVCAGSFILGDLARSVMFNTESRNGEDIEYILKILSKSKKAYFSGEGGYYYVANKNSITHKIELSDIDDIVFGIKNVVKIMEQNQLANQKDLEKYKLIKASALARRLYKKRFSYSAFKKKMKSYLSELDIKKIDTKSIVRDNDIAKKKKIKCILLNDEHYFLYYCITIISTKR